MTIPVFIANRGRTCAKIVPVSDNQPQVVSLAGMWKGYKKTTSVHVFINKLRAPRHEITTKAIYWTEEYGLSHGLRLADAIIAATADVYGKELLTGNTADYRFIPGLTLKTFRIA